MGELLHAGALVPATVGACCTLGARRSGRAASMLSALLMLAAMLDVASGARVLPVIGWAGLLIVAALAMSVAARSHRAASGSPERVGVRAVHDTSTAGMHGRLGLVVMAALLLAMQVPSAALGSHAVSLGHHGGGSAAVTSIALAASVGFALFSALIVWRAARTATPAPGRWIAVAETVCMGTSMLMMTGALWG